LAAIALAAHLAALVVLPAVHRAHHAAHGADHRHTADGIVWGAASAPSTEAHAHAALDADLEALGLGDVADAGVLTVDCALAPFTLATCDGSLPADHAHRFGDELVAHRHPPAPPRPDLDPDHARGALAHLAAPLAVVTVALAPPPPTLRRFVFPPDRAAPAVDARAIAATARAPPPAAAV
jgi:hypothetical protein